MYKFFSSVLEKMGIWYGLIIKLMVPLIVMYRPIKTLAFSIIIIGTYYGGEPLGLNTFCLVLFGLVYVVMLALLIWFPKAASAVEFFLIAYYIAFLGFLYVGGFYSSYLSKLTDLVWTYSFELPAVLVFLVFKILFYFFFIRIERKQLQMKQRHDELLYDSDSSHYLM